MLPGDDLMGAEFIAGEVGLGANEASGWSGELDAIDYIHRISAEARSNMSARLAEVAAGTVPAEQALADFDQTARSWLEDAPTRTAGRELAGILERIARRGRENAALYQWDARRIARAQSAEDLLDTYIGNAERDPDLALEFFAAGDEVLTRMRRTGTPEDAIQQRRRTFRADLGRAAFGGLAGLDPELARDQLISGDWDILLPEKAERERYMALTDRLSEAAEHDRADRERAMYAGWKMSARSRPPNFAPASSNPSEPARRAGNRSPPRCSTASSTKAKAGG